MNCTVLLIGLALVAAGMGEWVQTRSLPADEAHQAVAVDTEFVFAITNTRIGKYQRDSGRRVAESSGDAEHLNSGFVHENQLYCAHSNYPHVPEQSQIKVLDPVSMKLSTFHDFGNYGGSLTWVVRRDDHWWCNFAMYGDRNAGTFLVRFDDDWNETGRWTYPSDVLKAIGRYSLSGGVWMGDSLLVTDHDNPVIYRLTLPTDGLVLTFAGRKPAPFTGQGIAVDPVTLGLVGIHRARRLVVFAIERPAPDHR